jgi:hypothetical protein
MRVGTQVGIPALETFVPLSRPIVGQIKKAVDHHGQPFSVEELIAATLPEVQPYARFTPEQLPYVAALIQVALDTVRKT